MNSPLKIFHNQSYEEAVAKLGAYRKIVFTNGCFDIMHPGHICTLQFCHEQTGPGGIVVVGVNDDLSVRRLKGDSRPIMDLESRCLMLLSTRFVTHVISFAEDTPQMLIEALRPDVIVKGGDYSGDLNIVGRNIAPVLIAPLDQRWSTSKLISMMKGESCESSSRVI